MHSENKVKVGNDQEFRTHSERKSRSKTEMEKNLSEGQVYYKEKILCAKLNYN